MGLLLRGADTVYALRFLRLLTMPWEKTAAFKAGVVDMNGERLKKPETKEERKSVGLFEYSRWLFLYAAACLFVISLYQGVNIWSFNYQDFGWFVFLAAVPTMVGHNIFYFLVKTLSATTVAAVPLGEPVISSVGAFFLFNEPVSLFVFLGGLITLLGVYIIIRNDVSTAIGALMLSIGL